MKLISVNRATLHITSYSIFCERTKYIKAYCNFNQEWIFRDITSSFVSSNDQFVDVYNKP